MDRPNWHQYFTEIAHVVAKRSTCVRVPDGVGCVLVKDKTIVATGYAGSAKGQPHCIDPGVGCLIDPVAGGCVRTIHAEQNAIIHARCDLRGATAYTTLSPCWVCMRLLVQAGISQVIYTKEYRLGVEQQAELANAAGVGLGHCNPGGGISWRTYPIKQQ